MNNKKSLIYLTGMLAVTLCLSLGISSNAAAQNFRVIGKVISSSNQKPLVGVNILEVGTTKGTSTDQNGLFSIKVSSGNDSLRFSYIGFKTKVVKVNGRHNIIVKMQPSVANLNQLVVTALGIKQKKRALAYSTTQIKPKNIVASTVASTASLLAGQVAGVVVSPSSAGPGSATRVTIRGVSSIQGNNQPLYVVDGIPIDNSNFVAAADQYGGVAGGNGINMINPQNIKSISVLKGASAAALYGTRARNGVIIITTKSGKGLTGKPQVTVNSSVTFKSMLSSFTDYQTEYGQGSGGSIPQNITQSHKTGVSSWGAKYSPSKTFITYFGGKAPYIYHGNRAKKFYRNVISDKNSVSLAGGSKLSNYYFSTSYQNNPSIFPNSGLKRTSFDFRGSHTFFGKLKVDAKATYIRQYRHNRVFLGDSPGNANYSIFLCPVIYECRP